MSNLSNKLKKLSEQGFSHVETFLVMIVVVAIAGVGAYVIKHNESHAATATYSSLGKSIWNPGITSTYSNSDFYSYACKNTESSGDIDVEVAMTATSYVTYMKSGNYVPHASVQITTAKGIKTLPNLGSSAWGWNYTGEFQSHPGAWLTINNELNNLPPTDKIAMSPEATTYWPAVWTAPVTVSSLNNCTTTVASSSNKPITNPVSSPVSNSSTTTTTSSPPSASSSSGTKVVTTTTTTYTNFATIINPTSSTGYDNMITTGKGTQKGVRGYTTKTYVNGKLTSTKTVKPVNQIEMEGDSIALANGEAYPKGFTEVSLGSSSKDKQLSSTLFAEANAWFRGSLYPALSQEPGSGYGGDFIITACYSSSQAEIWAHALINIQGTNYAKVANLSDMTLNSYYHTSGGGIATGNHSETWTNNVSTSGQVVDTAAKDNPSTTTAWVRVGWSGGDVQTPSIILSKLPACLSHTYGT